MIITRAFQMDVLPSSNPPIIHTSRLNASTTLVFSLYTKEGSLSIPSGAMALMRGHLPDGTSVSVSGTFAISSSVPTVSIPLTKVATAQQGAAMMELVVSKSGYTLVTGTFILDIGDYHGNVGSTLFT